MDKNEKKDYLRGYKALVLRIKRLMNMKEINPEKKEKYEEEIKRCKINRDKIENEIEKTDGGILTEILAQKYIVGRSLEEIALIIGYCKRQTERLHLKALDKFCIST
ncbi:MAG: hypothetical protein IJJ40_06860 [Clostridia bacterium]|nr:hypothetical protein [Clostridia bacterium]